MSRSGYSDDCEGSELNLWRGAVNKAINGKRGQAFLHEALAALDAMPDKKLAAESLHETASGEYCTLGVVGLARGMDMQPLEDSSSDQVAKAFGIAHALAAEIIFANDDGLFYSVTPEKRWSYMRGWIASNIQRQP